MQPINGPTHLEEGETASSQQRQGRLPMGLPVVGTICVFLGLSVQSMAASKWGISIPLQTAASLVGSGFIGLLTLVLLMVFVVLSKSNFGFLRLRAVAKIVLASFFSIIFNLFLSRTYNSPAPVFFVARAVQPFFVVAFGLWFLRDRRPFQKLGLGIVALLCMVGAIVRDIPIMVQLQYYPIVSTATAVGWSFSFFFANLLFAMSLALFGSFAQHALEAPREEEPLEVQLQLLGGASQPLIPRTGGKKIVLVVLTFVVLASFSNCLFLGLSPTWNAIPNLGPVPKVSYYTGHETTTPVGLGYDQLRASLVSGFHEGNDGSDAVPLAAMSSIGLVFYMFGLGLTCLSTPMFAVIAAFASTTCMRVLEDFPFWWRWGYFSDIFDFEDNLTASDWVCMGLALIFFLHAFIVAYIWGAKVNRQPTGSVTN